MTSSISISSHWLRWIQKSCLLCAHFPRHTSANVQNLLPLYFSKLCMHCQAMHNTYRFIDPPFPITLTNIYQNWIIPLQYRDECQAWVHQFKYQANIQMGHWFIEQMMEQIITCYAHERFPQALIPIPKHPQRLRELGFHAPLWLAARLGKLFKIPVLTNVIIKIKPTALQSDLSAKQRLTNVHKSLLATKPNVLANYTRVAIIDDVMTTGSTLLEAARALPSHLELDSWCIAWTQLKSSN
ncbi:MAG: hypothetical protein V4629_13500 [Pseudomonadota bacterium]